MMKLIPNSISNPMRTTATTPLLSLLISSVLACVVAAPGDAVVVRMPDVRPTKPDTYLCFGYKVWDEPLQVVGYEPLARMNTAHHMLLYSCAEPARKEGVWNCGEMSVGGADNHVPSVGVCDSGTKLIYAWAMDATSLRLPPDVAFKISAGDTLVLQVHYNDVSKFVKGNRTDSSGIRLLTSFWPLPKSAAVYLAGTGGKIPKRRVTYLETACRIKTKKEMHPFAVRTHTHKLGRVVAGYRVRDADWTEIGRGNPRRPQTFYPTSAAPEELALRDGDYLAARCTMFNRHNRDVAIGATADDEMCNFYTMYWMDGDVEDPDMQCWSNGYPKWDWRKIPALYSDRKAPITASVQPPLEKDEEEVVRDDPYPEDAAVGGVLSEDDPRFVVAVAGGGRRYLDEKTRALAAIEAKIERRRNGRL